MTAVDQCSRCDAVDECVAENITTLEDVAGVIGCPTPSLHVHLVQHDRDDLLRRLTYGGKPILPHQVVEDPGTFEVEGADYAEPAKDPGVQPPGPATDGGVDAWGVAVNDSQELRVSSDSEWPEQPAETLTGPDDVELLQNLSDQHPSEDVRCAAESLLSALAEWEQDLQARTRLEQLVAQRDQLNAEIEALAARLGDVEPEAEPPGGLVRSEKPVRNLSAQDLGIADDAPSPKAIRAWCRDNGVHCPATGRVPRAAVEAYREAHGVA